MANPDPAAPPRLLLTGFAPFGPFAVNPSWELARRFSGQTIEMVDIVTACLPVNWATAWPTLQAAIEQQRPTWVLMLGVAGTRQLVSVETRARNHTEPRHDTAGAAPPASDLVEEDGPPYRTATLPAPLLAERIQEAGVPAEISTDAGGFLCNWTLYRALAAAPAYPDLRGVGFIHIPPAPDQGGPSITLDHLQQALRSAIESLVAGAAPLFALVEAEIEAERRHH